MLIEIITYFGCLKGARLCKKVFMCIAPFIGPLVCKSSQPHFVPVVRGPQAALCRCSVAVPRLGPVCKSLLSSFGISVVRSARHPALAHA